MISLALAAMFLPLGHFLIASTRLRGLLVHRWGAGLVSLAQVILLGDVAAILAFGSVESWGNPPQPGLGYTEGRNIKIMPTRYHFREYAVAGGLASYGV